MTLHIKRVVAAMAAVLMLLTLVPTAALPTIQQPVLSDQSVETTAPADDAAPTDTPDAPVATPDAPAATPDAPVATPDAPVATPDAPAATPDAPAATPDAPVATPDAPVATPDAPAATPDAPVATPDASDTLNSSPIMRPTVIDGPVTPEDVFTSDDGVVLGSDDTIYVDSDNDGEIEAITGDTVSDDDFADDTANNADSEYQDMLDSVVVGKDPVVPEEEPALELEEDSVTATPYQQSASGVDLTTGFENNAYEPTDTNNESHPFIPNGKAWIDLSKIKYGAPASPTYPFTAWSANTSFLNTSATAYDSDGRATAWLFPDKNLINSTVWSSANYESVAKNEAADANKGYAYNRYDAMQDKWGVTLDKDAEYIQFNVGTDNRKVNLSDTPYLCFSTEQEDDSQLAIYVRIGTPSTWNSSTGAATKWDTTQRWYCITDNNIRPGLAVEDMNHSMEPEVQIGKLEGAYVKNDQSFVSGAMTGCIDMTAWLPIVNPTKNGADSDVFDVDAVRIVKRGGKAARVNYLYFMNQGAPILSPQAVNADKDIATTASSTITADSSTTVNESKTINAASDDKNGWKNGKAITEWRVTGNGYGGKFNTGTASNFTYVTKNSKNYVTIIMPVRKWINVAIGARRLSFTVYCGAAENIRPVFSLYGNSTGFSDPDRNDSDGISLSDSLLTVIGGDNKDGSVSPYLVHKSSDGSISSVNPGLIDSDFSHHLDYSANSNWYDLLDSEGIRDTMVKSGDKAGWLYLNEIHIVVPTGVSFEMGQITLGNNSDSLNAGRSDGAFDGGTGVQPNSTIPTSSPYQTVTNQAAAFGPMLETSKFGTFDLLHRVSNSGDQGFYGRVYKATGSVKYGWNPTNTDTTMASGKYFIVYATCKYNSKTYGMIGDGGGNVRWAELTNAAAQTTNGKLYDYKTWGSSSTTGAVLQALNGHWRISPFANGWGDQFIFKKSDDGIYYANMDGQWDDEDWKHNTTSTIKSSVVQWGENNTYQESDTHVKLWSHTAMARSVPTPLTLQKLTGDGRTGTAPMLRYNFTLSNVDNSTNSNNYMRIALGVDVDGTNKLYYLKPDNTNKTITVTSTSSGLGQSHTFSGYASLDSIITENSGKTVKLTGVAVFARDSGNVRFRNLEVLYERPETQYNWYDEMRLSGSNVIDSVDVISDAFHYSIADGKTALTGSGYNLVGNYGEKGWKIGSYNLDTAGSGADSVSGYNVTYPQYRPQLDHLRIPIAAGKKGQIIFQADRSFPTANFKYLYVSYSMADDDGVAAMDNSGAGVSIALHGAQDSDTGYYMEVSSGKPTQMKYATTISKTKYSTSVNAAVDLSKISGLTSINEICFYFYNPSGKTTDVYINYLFLSNTAPVEGYQTVVSRPYYHNYYLMDGSGDRYSCRFPTTSNPTGRISDATNGNEGSRVNPLIIKRGDVFTQGTYYNGVPLAVPDKASSTAATSDDTASTITGTNGLKAIWFYDYSHSTLGESHNVNEYYQINAEQTTFKSDLTGGNVTFDALWNYNRWLTGWGLQRYLGYNKSAGTVDGTLLQLYATNNNVLLRTGLEPKKYQTKYDTQGGQMIYPGTSGVTDGTGFQSGIIENENNYYITQTVVLSYYTWPTEMGDKTKIVNPTKFGYTFNGWWTAKSGGTRIYRYNTMSSPSAATLYAQWVSDGTSSTYTAKFQKHASSTSSTYLWFSRKANRASEFQITIPWNTKVEIGGVTKQLYGWKVSGDSSGKVYTPGTTLTLTKSVTFLPVTTATSGTTCTVTLTQGSKLFLYQNSTEKEITNGYLNIKKTTSGSGSTATNTYSNIPLYTVVRAKPYSTSTYATGTYAWYFSDNGASAYSNDTGKSGTTGVATYTRGGTKATFTFAVSCDTKLSYLEDKDTSGYRVWTMPKPVVASEGTARQMMFYSQYEMNSKSSYTMISCGTIYTKDSQLAALGLTSSSSASTMASTLAKHMRFDASLSATGDNNTTKAPDYALSSAVRYVEATKTNAEDQYYLMVTENKGKAVTYYARGYLIFKKNAANSDGTYTYYYKYSPTITYASVPAAS